jgi:hypothetical protein
MWGGGADRQWSHLCSTGREPEAAHWSFYVFGLQEPLSPRLEQFDVSTGMLPEEALAAVRNSLQSQLTARVGPGEDLNSKFVSSHAFSLPSLRWQSHDIEIQLFSPEFDPQRREGRLRLLAKHRALLEALKEDERLKLVGTNAPWYEVGSAIDKQLADELRPDFPNVATMLVKQQPDPDPEKVREAWQKFQAQLKASQATGQTGVRAAVIAVPPNYWKAQQFHDALVKLLTSIKTAPPARQPVLLLAADQLALRLPWVIANDQSRNGDWSDWREELSTFGITYQPGSEEPWSYGDDLLKRVWTDYSETDWGQRAFVVLLNQGWDTSVDCEAGTDSFRTVIARGLEFLDKHPSSPYRLDVQLALAQAYETWWSLSQAPTGEEVQEEDADVHPANYSEGAEAARQKAIVYYEQFLQTAPQSDYATYARRMLPRLKLGIDTGQRRFYCSFAD